MPLKDQRFRGLLYRALNPVYARDPLSGRGAERYGGRFNPVGTPALYTALSPATALREANQVGDLQPTVLVAYQADIGPVFDTRDTHALMELGVSHSDLADPGWRSTMLAEQPVRTHAFAQTLGDQGYAGVLVRSYARGMGAQDLNLVLWRWSDDTASLRVIDDDSRLERM
ncbi:RES domain-containing protein [uncultured Tateyamaria sp.]|uniref:RES family NAD+ phosphorylase n=1 Tax=uncultured Tateyamaria sp. TaxID=455651 RepID=UPI002602CB90|nr:RES domain-containing protein [uncultured Tateyamaria sp.]